MVETLTSRCLSRAAAVHLQEELTLNSKAQSGSRRWFSRAAFAAMLVVLLVMTGCMYPQERRGQAVAPKEAIRNVQAAIDQYQSETAMLPIITASSATPVYEKYLVDFAILQRGGYLSDIPSAAFEKGGNFRFLVLDEETKPRIKLQDIVTFQQINDVQKWVTDYVQDNGKIPAGESMYPGFYQVNYKLLNKTEPVIRSVYSGQSLLTLVDDNGVVYADYVLDIMPLIQQSGKTDFDETLDLRTLLVDGTDFVPIKAPAYHWVGSEPQAAQP
jgi:hypothetical protein